MSRIDFTPAETTVIGVRPSTVRSADSSNESAKPRCTPPSPPVAKTRMPASTASTDVAATVVAPVTLDTIAGPRSRLETLMTDSSSAIRSSSEPESPTFGTPSIRAIVAGVTPVSNSSASNESAAARLDGRGRPWEMIVDSSATTGRPASSAERTAGDSSGTAGIAADIADMYPEPTSAIAHQVTGVICGSTTPRPFSCGGPRVRSDQVHPRRVADPERLVQRDPRPAGAAAPAAAPGHAAAGRPG